MILFMTANIVRDPKSSAALVCSLLVFGVDSFVAQLPKNIDVSMGTVSQPVSTISTSTSCYNGINLEWDGNAMRTQELERNLKKLDTFASYKENWNGYGAPPFTQSLIMIAKTLLIQLDNQPEVFPIAGGAIQFEYEKASGEYLEFEIEESESVHVYMVGKDSTEQEFNCALEKINEVVKKFYGSAKG